jgi:hypothetical protein
MASYEQGSPIYLTVNASPPIEEPILDLLRKVVKEANDYDAPLYITVNSGKPVIPPPTPPGG